MLVFLTGLHLSGEGFDGSFVLSFAIPMLCNPILHSIYWFYKGLAYKGYKIISTEILWLPPLSLHKIIIMCNHNVCVYSSYLSEASSTMPHLLGKAKGFLSWIRLVTTALPGLCTRDCSPARCTGTHHTSPPSQQQLFAVAPRQFWMVSSWWNQWSFSTHTDLFGASF